ncbi:hypothetical protein [Kribbella endophytica]
MQRIMRQWPEWVGPAARGWAVLYGALAVFWIAGGRAGFPVANVDGDPPGGWAVGTAIAVLLLAGCVAALVWARATSKAAVAGLVFATVAAGVGTFGLALSAVGIVASGTVERPLALVTQLAALVGAVVLFATVQVQSRRRRSRCPRCGGSHPGEVGGRTVRRVSGPSSARSRWSAYGLLVGLLPWATMKSVWVLGGSVLGVTGDEWQATMASTDLSLVSRLLERAGIDITVLAALVGAALVAALLHTRRVVRVLLLPAAVGAASLTLYGVPLTVLGSLTLTQVVPGKGDPAPFTASGLAWMVLFGGFAFAGLGMSLSVAARSYYRRVEQTCGAAR